jgi:hypothetical protein
MTLKLAAPNDGKETGYFVEEVVNGPLRKATTVDETRWREQSGRAILA